MAGFSPLSQGTYLLVAGITSTPIVLPERPGTVRIYNGGAVTAYIEIGGALAVIPVGGTPGSMPLAAGAGSIPLLLEKGITSKLSAITASGTAPLFITLGHGDTVG